MEVKERGWPRVVAAYSTSGCALATSPLRALAILSHLLLYPHEKAEFLAVQASSILHDVRLILQPPSLLY